MNVMEMLVESAGKNHGRQLTPDQVQQLVAGFEQYDRAVRTAEGRLDAVTRIAGVLLQREGGTAKITPAQFDEFEDSPGFLVDWDEETDIIHVTQAVEETLEVDMSTVPEEDDDGYSSLGDVPPLPDGSESGGPTQLSLLDS